MQVSPYISMPFFNFGELVPNGHVTVSKDGMFYATELSMLVTGKDRQHANNAILDLKPEIFNTQKLVVRSKCLDLYRALFQRTEREVRELLRRDHAQRAQVFRRLSR